MNTMTRRLIVNARNYDTPTYTPTVERETIAPMAPVRAFVIRWEYALTGAVVFAAVVGSVSL